VAQTRCPHCLLIIAEVRADAAGAVKCPHCGWGFRPTARTTPAPAAAEVGEEPPAYDVVDDGPPAIDRPAPRRPKKKRRGDKKPAGLRRHLPFLAIVGGLAVVIGVVTALVMMLGKRGGGAGDGLGGTGAVVSAPVPPLPPPNRPAPVPLPKKAPAAAAPPFAGKPALWTARPDPPAKPPPDALAPYAADLKGEFVLASLDGPFLVQLPQVYAQSAFRPKEPGRLDSPLIDNPLTPQPVIDLRTGRKAGEFHYKAPTWRGGRLAPDGQTIVGPDTSLKAEATKKDGLLFVWKRDAEQPAARLAVGAGAVLWADYVAPDKFAAAVFEERPGHGDKATFRVWDVAAGTAVHTVALEPTDLAGRHAFNPNQSATVGCSEYEMARGFAGESNTKMFYTPAETVGTVSPGGRYVALAGQRGVTVVSAAEGKLVGRLPLPGPLGRLDYHGFGFSANGATLYALVSTLRPPVKYQKRLVLVSWSMADGSPADEVVLNDHSLYGWVRPGPLPGTVVVPKRRGAGPPLPHVAAFGGTRDPDSGGALIDTNRGQLLWNFPGVVHRYVGGATAYVTGYWVHAPENTRPKKIEGGGHGLYALTADAAALREKAAPALAAAALRPAPAKADRAAARAVTAEAGPWAVPAPAAYAPTPLSPDARLPRWPDAWGDGQAAFINFTLRSNGTDVRYEAAWTRHDPASGQPVGAPLVLWPWSERDPGAQPRPDEVRAALTPDGNTLALRDPADPKRLDVWDTTGRRLTGFVPYPDREVEWLGFVSGDTLLTLAGGRLTAWEWRTARAIFEVDGGYEGPCLFPPGRAWVAAPAAAHVDFLDAKSGRVLGRCAADDGTATWHHTSLSPDGKLLLRTTSGVPVVQGNPPPALFVLWDLTTGKELPAVGTAVAPATNVYWCAPRRFLTVHGYQRVEGNGWRKFSHELIDVDALAVVGSYGPPKGYVPPRVGDRMNKRETDGLAGDPAGRVWVNVGGTWRPTPFPTPGPDAVLAGGGADLFPFRPGVTVRAEADLGERALSQKAAEALAGRLQQAGYVIGPDAWALRVRARRFETNQKLTRGPLDKDGMAVPGAKFTWELLTPSGSVAWSGTTEATWNYGNSKYKTGRKMEHVGPGFGPNTPTIVTTNFDFQGRSADAAIWDEILETAAGGLGPPAALPRALLEANGQPLALPLQAEFQVPAK
jgi:hypothetical protein